MTETRFPKKKLIEKPPAAVRQDPLPSWVGHLHQTLRRLPGAASRIAPLPYSMPYANGSHFLLIGTDGRRCFGAEKAPRKGAPSRTAVQHSSARDSSARKSQGEFTTANTTGPQNETNYHGTNQAGTKPNRTEPNLTELKQKPSGAKGKPTPTPTPEPKT